MTPERQDEVLADISKRHTTLHTVDKECTKAMAALVAMFGACSEHSLTKELHGVKEALSALHSAAMTKFKAL